MASKGLELWEADGCWVLQVPKEYIPGVTKGLEEMMSSGALAGFPVVDLVATLYDGSYHDVDSSVLAFQIAARQAFRWSPLPQNDKAIFQARAYRFHTCIQSVLYSPLIRSNEQFRD